MTYSVTDIAELIRHHLVFAETDEFRAAENLRRLTAEIGRMSPHELETTVEWRFCDRCGCAVDTDVLAWDGSNFTQDGAFHCSSCLPSAEYP